LKEKNYNKQDLEDLVKLTSRLVEAEVEFIERKYLKLTSDIKEIAMFGDKVYNGLKTVEERKQFLLKSLLKDGKLREDGINTKKFITDQVDLLVK